jgi:hypothetical protein
MKIRALPTEGALTVFRKGRFRMSIRRISASLAIASAAAAAALAGLAGSPAANRPAHGGAGATGTSAASPAARPRAAAPPPAASLRHHPPGTAATAAGTSDCIFYNKGGDPRFSFDGNVSWPVQDLGQPPDPAWRDRTWVDVAITNPEGQEAICWQFRDPQTTRVSAPGRALLRFDGYQIKAESGSGTIATGIQVSSQGSWIQAILTAAGTIRTSEGGPEAALFEALPLRSQGRSGSAPDAGVTLSAGTQGVDVRKPNCGPGCSTAAGLATTVQLATIDERTFRGAVINDPQLTEMMRQVLADAIQTQRIGSETGISFSRFPTPA